MSQFCDSRSFWHTIPRDNVSCTRIVDRGDNYFESSDMVRYVERFIIDIIIIYGFIPDKDLIHGLK